MSFLDFYFILFFFKFCNYMAPASACNSQAVEFDKRALLLTIGGQTLRIDAVVA